MFTLLHFHLLSVIFRSITVPKEVGARSMLSDQEMVFELNQFAAEVSYDHYIMYFFHLNPFVTNILYRICSL